MSSLDKLKKALQEDPAIKRIQELEDFIDKNEKLRDLFSSFKEVQKKMVNAKSYHQPRQYEVYKKEYNTIYQSILDFPFMEEYLELLEEAYFKLKGITELIENKINSKIQE